MLVMVAVIDRSDCNQVLGTIFVLSECHWLDYAGAELVIMSDYDIY